MFVIEVSELFIRGNTFSTQSFESETSSFVSNKVLKVLDGLSVIGTRRFMSA